MVTCSCKEGWKKASWAWEKDVVLFYFYVAVIIIMPKAAMGKKGFILAYSSGSQSYHGGNQGRNPSRKWSRSRGRTLIAGSLAGSCLATLLIWPKSTCLWMMLLRVLDLSHINCQWRQSDQGVSLIPGVLVVPSWQYKWIRTPTRYDLLKSWTVSTSGRREEWV